MDRYTYTRIRSTVRTIFWASLVGGTIWLVFDFNKRLDEYTCDSANDNTVVNQGDTLWRIVTVNCTGNLRSAVDDHVEFYGTDIQVGQAIVLKQNQDCELRRTDGGQVMLDC